MMELQNNYRFFENALLYSMIFLLGFLSCIFAAYLLNGYGVEKPLGIGFYENSLSAPGDWVTQDNVEITKDEIIIKMPNASLSRYAATGSMKPVLDENSNGLRISPGDSKQLKVGDIITYGEENIVHRIIEIGEDENGAYYFTKGDNNPSSDGVKIRFSDIKYVTIGVLY
jgi:hypothetical protein